MALLVAPVNSEAVPAGQGVHAEEPALVVKVPEGHVKQAASDAEPLVGLYEPALQGAQSSWVLEPTPAP